MDQITTKGKRRKKSIYWCYCKRFARFTVTSQNFHRSTKYIIALLLITLCSETLYVHGKIIRVDHHFFAPFTLIDSNKRLVWRKFCVQNLTDQASAQQCVDACVLNKNCTTINYHREKKICELLNMSKFDALGVLQYQPGWTHYETDDDARLMGPACYQLKPCKHYEVCEVTFTPKLYTCKCQDDFNGTECKNYIGPGSNKSVPAPACSLLMKHYKIISDGEYWIKGKNGTAVRKNCTGRTENDTCAKTLQLSSSRTNKKRSPLKIKELTDYITCGYDENKLHKYTTFGHNHMTMKRFKHVSGINSKVIMRYENPNIQNVVPEFSHCVQYFYIKSNHIRRHKVIFESFAGKTIIASSPECIGCYNLFKNEHRVMKGWARIEDKTYLPIKMISFNDVDHRTEWVEITLKKLICKDNNS